MGMRIRSLVAAVVVALLVSVSACSDGDDEQALFTGAEAPVLVEVPSVVGKTVDFAAGVLSTIGSPAVVEVVDGLEGIADTVVEQVPLAGTLVTRGSPIVVRVPAAREDGPDSTRSGGTTVVTTTTALVNKGMASVEESAPSGDMAKAAATTSATLAATPTSAATAPTTTEPPDANLTATSAVSTTSVQTPTSLASPTTVFPVSEDLVLASTFAWGESSPRVRLLQQVLGTTADGIYGEDTRAAHFAALSRRGLSTGGVPLAPVSAATTTTTTTTPTTTTTSTTTTTTSTTTTSTTTTTTTVAPVTTTTIYNRSLGLITTSNSYSASLNVGERDAWMFKGVTGAELIVRLTSSDLDVHLRVYNPAGTLIGDNDNTSGTNSYLKLVLCDTGTYTITADGTRKNSISTSTTDYTVSLEGGAATTTESLAAYFASTTCN